MAQLLERCRDDDLTYAPTGVSLSSMDAPGLTRRRWEVELNGEHAFDRAVLALRDWAVHRRSGIAVCSDGPLAVGTNVAMSAPLPIGYIEATCRIVKVIDEPDRFGFAYGTLPTHPEQGEEAFVVHRGPDRFLVEAVSRPSHPLARFAPWIADRLQLVATRRYLKAMSTAIR